MHWAQLHRMSDKAKGQDLCSIASWALPVSKLSICTVCTAPHCSLDHHHHQGVYLLLPSTAWQGRLYVL